MQLSELCRHFAFDFLNMLFCHGLLRDFLEALILQMVLGYLAYFQGIELLLCLLG